MGQGPRKKSLPLYNLNEFNGLNVNFTIVRVVINVFIALL